MDPAAIRYCSVCRGFVKIMLMPAGGPLPTDSPVAWLERRLTRAGLPRRSHWSPRVAPDLPELVWMLERGPSGEIVRRFGYHDGREFREIWDGKERVVRIGRRGRPIEGLREEDLRSLAKLVRWWLQHVGSRRRDPSRRLAHLSRVFAQLFPLRGIPEPFDRRSAQLVVAVFRLAASSRRRLKPFCPTPTVASILTLLLNHRREVPEDQKKAMSRVQRALR